MNEPHRAVFNDDVMLCVILWVAQSPLAIFLGAGE